MNTLKIFLIALIFSIFTGCATWDGVKEDSKDAYKWSKDKVNDGASYVKEKTE